MSADWGKLTKKQRSSFDLVAAAKRIFGSVEEQLWTDHCKDLHKPKRDTNCTCMSELRNVIDKEEKKAIVEYLMNFAKMEATQQRTILAEWMKYAGERPSKEGKESELSRNYLLPGTFHRICKNAVARMVGRGKDAWMRIQNHLGAGSSLKHGLAGRKGNKACQVYEERLELFFDELLLLGEPRATRLVAELAETENPEEQATMTLERRDADPDVIDLPSNLTKRGCYGRFLQENGWKYSTDSKGR